MTISELSIRGFKSYGNNEQILKLNTNKGELILLVGQNGAGKSSLLDSFDYVLYGKCKGKKKKWATLSTLPNRINGELLNKINNFLLKIRMVLGKVASQVIDQCITEINKHENIQAIKNKLLNPCFIHIYKYFHKYIILF